MSVEQYELFQRICQRPAMYVGKEDYDSVCSYLDGMNSINRSLIGFREWLVVKADTGDNLGWWGVASWLAHEAGVQDDPGKIRFLGELLTEFREFGKSTKHNTLLLVHLRYYHWLTTKSWFNPNSPHYIDPKEFQDL